MTIPPYRLRPPTHSDVQPYGQFLSDKNISIWLEDACQKPLSETAIEDFVLRSGWCHWAIESDGQFCGLTGLDDPDLSRGQARFFIVLGMTDLWGQGMGTAVTQQVLDYGFKVLQLRKIVSDYLAKNTSKDVILQQDVGWTTYAGKDPIDYVKRYPGRTLTTHYKVKLPKGTTGKLPIIGQDTIDWLALTKANIAVGGTQWLVVEQEEYPNGLTPLQAVAKSKNGLDKIIENL